VARKPVVASNVGGNPELVVDGETDIWCALSRPLAISVPSASSSMTLPPPI